VSSSSSSSSVVCCDIGVEREQSLQHCTVRSTVTRFTDPLQCCSAGRPLVLCRVRVTLSRMDPTFVSALVPALPLPGAWACMGAQTLVHAYVSIVVVFRAATHEVPFLRHNLFHIATAAAVLNVGSEFCSICPLF